jgi:D-alanyl-D-alanine dipeptidase
MHHAFVFVDDLVPGIRWDAKYATWDNFTGKPVDGYLANRIVGSRALCAALDDAHAKAAALGFGLLLWDGYRPQRAVDCFARWSRQPEDGRKKVRHYPNIDRPEMFEKGYVAERSGHSRGGTVDLTLYHLSDGELAAMGGDHDLMDPISHHGAKGITRAEASNRRYLRSIMEASGFDSYECEWWHYTLKVEPFPHTYFDFPITQVVLTPGVPVQHPRPHGAARAGRQPAPEGGGPA